LGLIPQSIREEAGNIDRFCELLAETRYVGEIGLDYVTEDESERRLQQQIFARILQECATAGNKILSIHYFSINTAMVSSRRARRLIALMNPDRILTETDGPFIQFSNRPALPRDIVHVFHYLASQWGCTPLIAAQRIYENHRKAFTISD
jgi:TatD DNase family protein